MHTPNQDDAGAGPANLRLEPVSGPPAEAVSLSGALVALVGRGDDAVVRLPDAAVSRRHAEIRLGPGVPTIRDLDSRNGVFVNTIRMDAGETSPLTDGDLVGFGPWTFRVVLPPGSPAPPPGTFEDAGDPPPAPSGSTVADDSTATRATIFLRMNDAKTTVREVTWEEFARRYAPIILAYARSAGMAAADADDILQEVLLGFFRRAGSFEYDPSKGRFRGYLRTITRNAINTRFRRQRPEAALGAGDFLPDPARADEAWDNEWTRQILERALEEARREFERRTWEAFEHYGRHGVPAEEVAHQLDMTVENVRLAKSRVAKKVRAIVMRLREEEG